ncbi:hypothetical protein [Chromobacterium sp. IIBBL 290-4]|uniref:hypothetical protein n=1 Tax=Chromobacterium sp. IIBBL 290-4 TaxID=2953890 RepID=UPI0020B80F10|nr:hypothetical protein [Chromobacterium sp. IIBBL 290-4]UTH75796.1 hypothetical protein NKT35_06760 [Chromobacterium sp. IIBBL 290-4]
MSVNLIDLTVNSMQNGYKCILSICAGISAPLLAAGRQLSGRRLGASEMNRMLAAPYVRLGGCMAVMPTLVAPRRYRTASRRRGYRRGANPAGFDQAEKGTEYWKRLSARIAEYPTGYIQSRKALCFGPEKKDRDETTKL